MKNLPDKNYGSLLSGLKEKIRLVRTKAVFTANAQLLELYWEIGNTILQQQATEGWGTKVIKRLAQDLKSEFHDMKGLSERNLVYMQTFAAAYPYFPFTQAPLAKLQTNDIQADKITQVPLAQLSPAEILLGPLAKLTWYHHITLLDKVKSWEERLFYQANKILNL